MDVPLRIEVELAPFEKTYQRPPGTSLLDVTVQFSFTGPEEFVVVLEILLAKADIEKTEKIKARMRDARMGTPYFAAILSDIYINLWREVD